MQVGRPGATGIAWSSLPVRFRVRKTREREPNKAEISIVNPAPESIAVAQEEGAIVRLLAGYGIPQQLFIGGIDRQEVVRERTDRILRIEATDGGRRFREARLDRSYAAGTSVATIFADLAEALGLDTANLDLPDRAFAEAVIVSGPVRDTLDRFAAALGLEWFVQDGQPQIFPADATTETGPLISATTGMVGSPRRTIDDKDRAGVQVRSLLLPGLQPTQRFELQARDVAGVYRVDKVEHVGDSSGGDWHTIIEGLLT